MSFCDSSWCRTGLVPWLQSMMTLKERKEMEDSFKKAQKPWAKLLQKVEKTKAEYHNSCKTERTAANMERNASADSSLSPDQVNVVTFPLYPTGHVTSLVTYNILLTDLRNISHITIEITSSLRSLWKRLADCNWAASWIQSRKSHGFLSNEIMYLQ